MSQEITKFTIINNIFLIKLLQKVLKKSVQYKN